MGFVFSAGWKCGADRLHEVTEKLGVSCKIEIGLSDASLPTIFDEEVITDREKREAFIEFCSGVGKEILRDAGQPDHDEAWIGDRILGYGNRGLLITFPYNTPSQTLTCLWRRGEFRNAVWMPLLPRRKKT